MDAIGDPVGFARPFLLCTTESGERFGHATISASAAAAGRAEQGALRYGANTFASDCRNHGGERKSDQGRFESFGTRSPVAEEKFEERQKGPARGLSCTSLVTSSSPNWWVADPSSDQSTLSGEWNTTSLMAFHGAKASRRQSAVSHTYEIFSTVILYTYYN